MTSDEVTLPNQHASTKVRCTNVDEILDYQCQRPQGHAGMHSFEGEGAITEWSDPLDRGTCDSCEQTDVLILSSDDEDLCVDCDREARDDH